MDGSVRDRCWARASLLLPINWPHSSQFIRPSPIFLDSTLPERVARVFSRAVTQPAARLMGPHQVSDRMDYLLPIVLPPPVAVFAFLLSIWPAGVRTLLRSPTQMVALLRRKWRDEEEKETGLIEERFTLQSCVKSFLLSCENFCKFFRK